VTAPGPAFLGIGAQKAGSTWLHVNLAAHPETWLPPVKELNYFSPAGADAGPGALGRCLGRSREASRHRRHFVARLLADLRARSLRDLSWDLRFFLGARHDGWYLGLFPSDGSRLAGEISPAYSTIGPEGVAHVRRLLPDARILLVLRDPIERSWSETLMHLVKLDGRSPGSLSPEELERFVVRRWLLRLGDYPRILDDWSAVRSERRLFVGFFDDLRGDPAGFLVRVQRFLGLEAPERVPETCTRKVNANVALPLPPLIERRIAELHLDSLRELARRFDGPPRRWLARAEAALAPRPGD